MSIQAISKLVFVFVLIFISLSFVSAIRINEVELNPEGTDSGNEWVELYSNEQINLTDWKICSNNGRNMTFNASFAGFLVINTAYNLLTNDDNRLQLRNSSEDIIFETINLSDSYDDNRTWQYCDGNWNFANSTKGAANLCTTQTNSTNQTNQTQQNNQTQTTSEPAETEIDLAYEHEVEREFEVELKASNIQDKKYDVKICVMDGNKVISEIYDDNDEKWVSGRLYVDERISPANKKEVFNLRIKKEYENFSGKAKINARLRESDSDKYIETTGTIKIVEYKSGAVIKNISIEKETLSKEDAIKLAPKDIKSYKSKTEYVKEYAIYGFAVFCIMLFTLIWLKKSVR